MAPAGIRCRIASSREANTSSESTPARASSAAVFPRAAKSCAKIWLSHNYIGKNWIGHNSLQTARIITARAFGSVRSMEAL